MKLRTKRACSTTGVLPTDTVLKRRKTLDEVRQREGNDNLPVVQSALKLHAIRQPYDVATDHPLPTIQQDSELLVKVQAVGLNPIDWKAPYVAQTLHLIPISINKPPVTTTSVSLPYHTYPAANMPAQ
jgi:hypothetical protein